MKKIFTVMLMAICALTFQVKAQAIYQVSTDEIATNASDIIEGKVIEQRSFWNPAHTMIYTSNKIEVYKNFKGLVQSATIEVVTTGGTVGTERIEASDLLTLDKGNTGIFFCYPNSIQLASPFTGNQLYDVYAGSQGFIQYNINAKTASGPFLRYNNIQNILYPELVQKTGRQPRIINSTFNLSLINKPQTPLAPFITSFAPMVVNAGASLDPANNLLTINGSGFGNTPTGTSAVLFDDANNGSGGTPFEVLFNSPLVQSWTDNQIKIRVPSRAGTGYFEVREDATGSASSPDLLTVNYAILSSEFTSGGVTINKEINLMNDNGSGGYTVLYSTATDGGGVNLDAAPEKETFQRALNTWKEVAGFNVIEGGTTGVQSVAGDGFNVIMFDNTNTGRAPLAAGVLAVCFSYSNVCTPVASNEVQKTEFDIVIRNIGVSAGTTSFTSGPCPPATRFSQIDLETVLLHELGHALNLAHINESYEGSSLPNVNPGKLMNFAVVNGVSRKSPDYSALMGALYVITPQANTYGSCGLPNIEMTPATRIIAPFDECPVSFPTTATPSNTIVNFDLVHTTSNKYQDPAYIGVNCLATGTAVTNNAYYAIKTDNLGSNLNIVVSGYGTYPASVQNSCVGNAGIRLALYQTNICPAGQGFPSPVTCRTFNADGALSTITGLAPNTTYLIYLDGINNTKANFSLTLNAGVLPVTLTEFKGNLGSNNTVNLFWKTSSEINSRQFEIEKSFDGATFNAFATVAAKGNSNTESNYAIADHKPYSDFSFYRLKIVDRDGRFRYSDIVKIKTPKKAVVIGRIYPNPTSGKLTVQVMADSRKLLTVETYDLLGKKVTSATIAAEQGFSEKAVYVQSLAAGTYFIQVKDAAGNILEKSKFIKN